jgi:Flp pilus assembly protein TadD
VLGERIRRCAGLTWYEPSSEARRNELGYRVLRGGNAGRAVAIFALNTTAHPASWNAWDSEGEALAHAGRTADAVAAYRRSLGLDPANEGARSCLRDHAAPAAASSGR